MIKTLFYVSILLLVFSFSGCITTPGINSGSAEIKSRNISLKVAFNDYDRNIIKRYYGRHIKDNKSKKMPPGLAKKQSLPPGLQKHVEKNGVLPPGLQGRSLPVGLEHELSSLPNGYVRLKIGSDVVLMNEKTRVVFDVVLGVDN